MVLDFRFVASCIFALLTFSTALQRAFASPFPDIPSFPEFEFPRSAGVLPGFVAALLDPFVLVVNVLIGVVVFIVDVLWKLIATVAIYFYLAGRELAVLLWNIFAKGRALVEIGRVCLMFLISVSIILVARFLIDPVIRYILSSDWQEGISELVALAVPVAGLLFLAIALMLLIDGWPPPIQNFIFGVSFVLAIILISGLPLHLASHQGWVYLAGFGVLGPFSVTLLALVGFGFFVLILRKIASATNS